MWWNLRSIRQMSLRNIRIDGILLVGFPGLGSRLKSETLFVKSTRFEGDLGHVLFLDVVVDAHHIRVYGLWRHELPIHSDSTELIRIDICLFLVRVSDELRLLWILN